MKSQPHTPGDSGTWEIPGYYNVVPFKPGQSLHDIAYNIEVALADCRSYSEKTWACAQNGITQLADWQMET